MDIAIKFSLLLLLSIIKVFFLLVHLPHQQLQQVSATYVSVQDPIQGPSRDSIFGDSMSMSADGSTVAVGAPGLEDYKGGVYTFALINNQFSHPSGLIRGSDVTSENPNQGHATALNADGSILVFSGYNEDSLWVFNRTGVSSWIQNGPKLNPADCTWCGYTVAISANAGTIAVGGLWNSDNIVVIYRKQLNNLYSMTEMTPIHYEPYTITSIALSGNGSILVHGQCEFDEVAGQVQVYRFNQELGWTPIGGKLEHSSGDKMFGKFVSLSSDAGVMVVARDIGVSMFTYNVIMDAYGAVQQISLPSSTKVSSLSLILNGNRLFIALSRQGIDVHNLLGSQCMVHGFA